MYTPRHSLTFGIILALMLLFLASSVQAGMLLTAAAEGNGVRTLFQPDGVETDASCRVTFWVVDDETALEYRIECFKIIGVTEVHLHAGDENTISGSHLIWIFGFPMGSNPYFTPKVATGQTNGLLSEGVIHEEDARLTIPLSWIIKDMKAGETYVNVATEVYRRGEVRGQVDYVYTPAGSPKAVNPRTSGKTAVMFLDNAIAILQHVVA